MATRVLGIVFQQLSAEDSRPDVVNRDRFGLSFDFGVVRCFVPPGSDESLDPLDVHSAF